MRSLCLVKGIAYALMLSQVCNTEISVPFASKQLAVLGCRTSCRHALGTEHAWAQISAHGGSSSEVTALSTDALISAEYALLPWIAVVQCATILGAQCQSYNCGHVQDCFAALLAQIQTVSQYCSKHQLHLDNIFRFHILPFGRTLQPCSREQKLKPEHLEESTDKKKK